MLSEVGRVNVHLSLCSGLAPEFSPNKPCDLNPFDRRSVLARPVANTLCTEGSMCTPPFLRLHRDRGALCNVKKTTTGKSEIEREGGEADRGSTGAHV